MFHGRRRRRPRFSRVLGNRAPSVAAIPTGADPMNRLPLLLALLAIAAPATAAEVALRGSLSGENVVSATESPATGEVAAVLEDDNDLRIDLIYSGLATNATGAGFYTGKASENGARVAPLAITAGTTEGQLRGAVVRLTPAAAAQVRAGQSYVQIVSLDQPDGVIRAQLRPLATTLSASAATNAAVSTTPSTTGAAGAVSGSASAASGVSTGTSTITPTNPTNDDDRDDDDD